MKTLKFKDIFKADDENDKNEDDTIESVEPTRYSTNYSLKRRKIPLKNI